MRKNFKSSQTVWNKFLKLSVNTLAPVIGMAFGAKSKNLQIVQASTKLLKSKAGGKVLSLTDMHGNGLRLRAM